VVAPDRVLSPVRTCIRLANPSSAAKRLYVEPFATKAGPDELREDVTARLRKLSSLSIVGDPGNADLILAGGGEIWIKGYRSFSPRSHMKMPTNGIPIYGGYLCVELKNRKGVTVWSYLATPDAASDHVSKDISKRITKHLAEALTKSEIQTSALFQRPSIALAGAGATFPYPVYQKWFTHFPNRRSRYRDHVRRDRLRSRHPQATCRKY
jgi:hypothetical protein